MKKLIWTLAICIFTGLTSCSGSLEDAAAELEQISAELEKPTVVGFWEMSDFDMGVEIPAEQQAMFDSMKEEMVENSNLSIKDDGTFAQNDYMNEEMTSNSGTYVVDGSTIKMTVDDVETVMEISKLTSTEMSLAIEDNGATMTMTYKRP